MAVTMASAEGVKRITNDATALDLTKITFPSGTQLVMIRSIAAAGYVTYTGTDGAAMGSHYATIAADSWFTLPLSREAWGSPPIIYIAHANNSGITEILPVPG